LARLSAGFSALVGRKNLVMYKTEPIIPNSAPSLDDRILPSCPSFVSNIAYPAAKQESSYHPLSASDEFVADW